MDVSVFLGAFLGFLAGLLTQGLVTWHRRRETRKVHRNLLAIELMENLLTLDAMLEGIRRTRAASFASVEMIQARPRASALSAIATSNDVLLSLPSEEQTGIVQLVGQVHRAVSEYEDWPRTVADQHSLNPVPLANGQTQTLREFMTQQLQSTLETVLVNHMGTLAMLLNSSKRSDLSPASLRPIWDALAPTRRRWRRSKALRLAVVLPDPPQADAGSGLPLLVWSGSQEGYPVEAIEMKPLLRSAEGRDLDSS